MYSTPKVSRARAISTLSSVRKEALENCSPSRRVESMSFQFGLDMFVLPRYHSKDSSASRSRTRPPEDGSVRKPKRFRYSGWK